MTVQSLLRNRITINEACKLADVDRTTLFRWRNHGVRGHRLQTFRVGHRVFIREADLLAFLEAINDDRDEPLTDRADEAGAEISQRYGV